MRAVRTTSLTQRCHSCHVSRPKAAQIPAPPATPGQFDAQAKAAPRLHAGRRSPLEFESRSGLECSHGMIARVTARELMGRPLFIGSGSWAFPFRTRAIARTHA